MGEGYSFRVKKECRKKGESQPMVASFCWRAEVGFLFAKF